MASYSGYITYVAYTVGSAKGALEVGTTLNDPFHLGPVDSTYTSNVVVESADVDATAAAAHKITVTPLWTPSKALEKVAIGNVNYEIVAAGSEVANTSCSVAGYEITFASADTQFVAGAKVKFGYTYDNVYIPQNELPLLNAEIKSIPLIAKARRIAVYYSQIAAFQAKTDYGLDLGDQLAEKACGQLAYWNLVCLYSNI